jgi:hypothetical protein
LPEIPGEIRKQLARLCTELDKRARTHTVLNRYYEGSCPLPDAIVRSQLTKAYRLLMPVAEAPWGSLIVDSTQDRLEVSGIDSGEKAVDDVVWGIWQDNQMDAESKIAHNATLVDGRSFALVWREQGDETPEISLDNAATMIVQYREGSRRHRVAALRRWIDEDDIPHATLYRRDAIFKFKGPKESSGQAGTRWEPRVVGGEEWPLPNPWNVVPVVELAVNRRLKPGSFGYARGEYQHCLGLIDRINLLTFLGLVVAFWMGFPLRGVIGEKVLKDDDGNQIAPFDAQASGVFMLENKDAKIVEYEAADRKNLSVFAELDQLSSITKTPRHYFPIEGGMSNLSADAIRASDGSLHAKVTHYKPMLGEGHEEILRLGGLMAKEPVILSPRAELQWMDHESRSMAERADAAIKIGQAGFPWQFVAEKVLNVGQSEIAKIEAQMSSGAFAALLAEAQRPTNGTGSAGGTEGAPAQAPAGASRPA